MPKLSIITVNLNNLYGLQKTMESVFPQTFTDYEYIIIDGGSTDGSREYIEQHSVKLSYWISEQDTGIYQAMNKGILQATGQYLLFLNSGDYLVNAEVIIDFLFQGSGEDILYGILNAYDKGRFIQKDCPEKLSFSFFLNDTLPHPSTLIKRKLFTEIGLYNENLRSTSDWEFFLNAICKYNVSYKKIPLPVAVFNTEGLTSQEENWVWIRQDKARVLEEGYSAFMDDYKGMRETKRQLQLIEGSRFWKLRCKVMDLRIIKIFFK